MGVPKSVGGRREMVGLSERGDGGSDVGGENGSHASSPAEARVNPRALAAATSIAATRLAGEPASALRIAGEGPVSACVAGATDDIAQTVWPSQSTIDTAAPGHWWILSEVSRSRGHGVPAAVVQRDTHELMGLFSPPPAKPTKSASENTKYQYVVSLLPIS